MPFDPPYRQFAPSDLVMGTPDGRRQLAEFLRRGGEPVDGPVTLDDLDDFLAPDATIGPVSRAFHAALRAWPDYADMFDPRHPEAFRARRRGKAVLEWASYGGGPNVHFSLQGVDGTEAMREVAGKTSDEDKPAGPSAGTADRYAKARNAVGAELRWLYRHRRVTRVREHVQFWRPAGTGFTPCAPPWSWPGDAGAAWADYRPTREYSDADSK